MGLGQAACGIARQVSKAGKALYLADIQHPTGTPGRKTGALIGGLSSRPVEQRWNRVWGAGGEARQEDTQAFARYSPSNF